MTDYYTFGYLADVFIIESHRGNGLSKTMIRCFMELDWVSKLRRLMLATQDAHSLYEQYGFVPLANPGRFMEINKPRVYEHTAAPNT